MAEGWKVESTESSHTGMMGQHQNLSSFSMLKHTESLDSREKASEEWWWKKLVVWRFTGKLDAVLLLKSLLWLHFFNWGGKVCVLYSISYFSLHQNLPLISESFFWNPLEHIHGLGEEFGAGDSLGKRETKHFSLEYLTLCLPPKKRPFVNMCWMTK